MSTADMTVDVRRVAGSIGAEIVGLRACPDMASESVALIRDALHEHKVIFFRGQEHLDDAGQTGFARRFGQLTGAHPTVPAVQPGGHVLELDADSGGGKANAWHSDVTFVDRPPALSFLRPLALPRYGGDTAWANTATAYQGLSPELRRLAERLWALHSNVYDYAVRRPKATPGPSARDEGFYRDVFLSALYETEHPVVQMHPETGERCLLLGLFVRDILGMSADDSRHIFELLQGHITRLRNTIRWHWELGDLAIWDNRATQHFAIDDYGSMPRRVRRVTVVGEAPISVDGRRSVARAGDSSAYSSPAAGSC